MPPFLTPLHEMHRNNIMRNWDKQEVELVYADDFLFYRKLDELIREGRRVKVIFSDQAPRRGPDLVRRLACCRNRRNLIRQMIDLMKSGPRAVQTARQNFDFSGVYQIVNDFIMGQLYASYHSSFEYDRNSGRYFIRLEPDRRLVEEMLRTRQS